MADELTGLSSDGQGEVAVTMQNFLSAFTPWGYASFSHEGKDGTRCLGRLGDFGALAGRWTREIMLIGERLF